MNPTLTLLAGRQRRAAIGMCTLALGAAATWALQPYQRKQAALRWMQDVCSTAGRPMFAAAAAGEGAGAGTRPVTVVTPLACDALPNVSGKAITTVLVEYPPGAYSPARRHPGSVTAFVVQGTVRSQLGGGPVVGYAAGRTWFDPPGTLHVFAENPDPVHAARLLAAFVTEEECGALVLPP